MASAAADHPAHTDHQPQPPQLAASTAPDSDWRQLTAALAGALLPWGLDIVHPFPLELYNARCPIEAQELQPAFAKHDSTLAVVVGNSAAMWQPFLRQLAAQHQQQPEQLLALQDPLDQYVQQHVTDAVLLVCSSHGSSSSATAASRQQADAAAAADGAPSACRPGLTRHELRFSHESGERFVNMMAAAQLSGLAYNSPTTHLCWHPLHGPWFALRALVVFDCEGPAASSIQQLPCPHPEIEAEAAIRMQRLQQQLGGLANWKQHWREWADLRALGGRHTHPRHVYCPDQLEYHYTKSKAVLVRAVTRLWEEQPPPHEEQTELEEARAGTGVVVSFNMLVIQQ